MAKTKAAATVTIRAGDVIPFRKQQWHILSPVSRSTKRPRSSWYLVKATDEGFNPKGKKEVIGRWKLIRILQSQSYQEFRRQRLAERTAVPPIHATKALRRPRMPERRAVPLV